MLCVERDKDKVEVLVTVEQLLKVFRQWVLWSAVR